MVNNFCDGMNNEVILIVWAAEEDLKCQHILLIIRIGYTLDIMYKIQKYALNHTGDSPYQRFFVSLVLIQPYVHDKLRGVYNNILVFLQYLLCRHLTSSRDRKQHYLLTRQKFCRFNILANIIYYEYY